MLSRPQRFGKSQLIRLAHAQRGAQAVVLIDE